MLKKTYLYLIFFLYGYSISISAVVVEDLYTINVSQVADICGTGSREERDTYKEGMIQLLVRITGLNTQRILSDQTFISLIEEAEKFSLLCGPRINNETLSIGFNNELIESELAFLGIPRWGRERPVTLVWFSINTSQDEVQILSSKSLDLAISDSFRNFHQQLFEGIQIYSNNRALPVILPLLDLQDISVITADNISNRQDTIIESASNRYKANYILYASGYVSEYGRLEAQWYILRNGKSESLSFGTLEAALDELSFYYASIFQAHGDIREFKVTISGIENLGDYASTILYLESIDFLEEVNPIEVGDGNLVLLVSGRGDQHLLHNILELDSYVVKSTSNDSSNEEDGLFFRLNR
jgi:hypothetical protein